MICHRSSAALIDRPDQLHNLVGFDFAGEAIAPERVGNLIEAFFRLLPGRLAGSLQRRNVALEQIGDGRRSSVSRNLDAATPLDHVSEVAFENFALARVTSRDTSRASSWHVSRPAIAAPSNRP